MKEKNTEITEENIEKVDSVENEEIINEEQIETESVESNEESTETEISELDQLKEEIEALEEKNLRLQAEIANIRRINQREREDAAKYRSQSLANELLDVIDNLERALETEVESEDGLALKKGVEMVHNLFLQAFENEKIETINPLNEPFDPNFEQAVSVMPAEEGQESNTVVNVLQKGYRIDKRVIRPAMVIVSE
ncbi:nucleotide exchange factor GrpE [Aerococcaceae bacterium WGS1372]